MCVEIMKISRYVVEVWITNYGKSIDAGVGPRTRIRGFLRVLMVFMIHEERAEMRRVKPCLVITIARARLD